MIDTSAYAAVSGSAEFYSDEDDDDDDFDDDGDFSNDDEEDISEEEEEDSAHQPYERVPRVMPRVRRGQDPSENLWRSGDRGDPRDHDGPYDVHNLDEEDIWKILDQHAQREREFLRTCKPVQEKRQERGKKFSRLKKTKAARDALLKKKRAAALSRAISRGEQRLRGGTAVPWQAQQRKDAVEAAVARRQAAWRKKQSKLRPAVARPARQQQPMPVIRRMPPNRAIVNRVPASVALAASRRSGMPGSAVIRPGHAAVEEQYDHLERHHRYSVRPQPMRDPRARFIPSPGYEFDRPQPQRLQQQQQGPRRRF